MTGCESIDDARFSLDQLLNPRSIALVGVTENSFWSRSLVSNLLNLGYDGAVHLVNPKYDRQFGLPCFASVRDIPGPVDSAYIMTGIDAVETVLDDCAAKGIRSVTILTAGFKETGDVGAERERRLVEHCFRHGITVLGPNCLGFINFPARVVAYALPISPPLVSGNIAVVTHSGAMLQHIQRVAQQRNIGLSYLVSSGNEAMLDAADLLGYFVDLPQVRVIGALLEGIRDARGFLRVAQRALERGKPLVILKLGRSRAGARVAQAHTGALAGSRAVVEAVFRQWGIIQVDTIEELLDSAALLARHGWPSGRRTAVIAPSGGACGLISDLAEGTRIEIPDFTPQTKRVLANTLPEFGTPQNPLDTTGYVVLDSTLLSRTAEAAAKDANVDCLLIVSDPPREPGPLAERSEERLRLLAETIGKIEKYCVVSTSVSGELTSYARELASRYNLHFGNGLALTIRALDHAMGYAEIRERYLRRRGGKERSGAAVDPSAGTRRALPGELNWIVERRGVLTEWESKQVLRTYGIRTPKEGLAKDEIEAVAIAREIGYPVVLKVQSADLPHKTEAGGVRLNLYHDEDVRQAYHELIEAVQASKPTVQIDGILVARQVQATAELIVGMVTDPQFGPVVLVGSGGVLAEIVRDFTMRLPPIDHEEAREMLQEIRAHAVLQGVRNRPPGDIDATADCLVQLGVLALDLADYVQEVDINPLLVLPRGQGVVAADALMVLKSN